MTSGSSAASSEARDIIVARTVYADVLAAVRAGEPCWLIGRDGLGKTTALAWLAARLAEEPRTRAIYVDLATIQGEVTKTKNAWLSALGRAIDLDVSDKLDADEHHFERVAKELVADRDYDRTVVLLDNFHERLAYGELYTTLHSYVASRAKDAGHAWERLTFVLTAPRERPASPKEDESHASPWRTFRLTRFGRAELDALAGGPIDEEAERTLDAVFAWTSGEPALSKDLVAAASAHPDPGQIIRARVSGPRREPSVTLERFAADPESRRTLRAIVFRRSVSESVERKMAELLSVLQARGYVHKTTEKERTFFLATNRFYEASFAAVWYRWEYQDKVAGGAVDRWRAKGRPASFALTKHEADEIAGWLKQRKHDSGAFELAAAAVVTSSQSWRTDSRWVPGTLVACIFLLLCVAGLQAYGKHTEEGRIALETVKNVDDQQDAARQNALSVEDAAVKEAEKQEKVRDEIRVQALNAGPHDTKVQEAEARATAARKRANEAVAARQAAEDAAKDSEQARKEAEASGEAQRQARLSLQNAFDTCQQDLQNVRNSLATTNDENEQCKIKKIKLETDCKIANDGLAECVKKLPAGKGDAG